MPYNPDDDRDPDWTLRVWPPVPGTYSDQLYQQLIGREAVDVTVRAELREGEPQSDDRQRTALPEDF